MAVSGIAAARQAITRLKGVVKEAVHVKIYPRPRNLVESTEVLRVLQQYGEVAMFKHLKYESVAPAHNTVIAIYQSAASAQKLIDASPIKFELQDGKTIPSPSQGNLAGLATARRRDGGIRPQESRATDEESRDASDQVPVGDATFQGLGGVTKWGAELSAFNPEELNSPADPDPSGDLLSNALRPNLPSSQAPDIPAQIPVSSSATTFGPPPPRPPREFQLTILPSTMDHAAYIERQGYYGGFNPDTSSIMAEDLEARVPMHGLVDCQIRRAEAPARVVATWRERAAQQTMTLRELWENGKKEREEIERNTIGDGKNNR